MHKPLGREKRQFAVLYSRFLLRVVDLESLSVQADVTKLLGQIAAILVMFSLITGLEPLIPGLDRMPPADRIPVIWNLLHRMIAATMLVVGLFAVLSWDSTFPDRRDVMVFAPLPVRPRTLFFARIGAAGTMLCLAMLALNVLPGLIWPLIFSHGGLAGMPRTFVAYWVTILASGAFLYGSVLTVQGVTAHLLPRRHFLRLSAFLQIACFCLFLAVYFLQPSLAAPKALASPANHRLLCWLPSYWFLGFFHALNGSTPRAPAFLVARGWAGVAIAVVGAGTALMLSYYRALRRIVEEPDIVPGAGAVHWPLRFALSLRGTIALFSLRSLLRSRQHRVVVAFWLGVGFALALSCLSIPAAQPPPGSNISPVSLRFIISTVVMMSFAVMGVRVAFSLPVTLPANWIFRMTELRSPQEYVAAVRWSLLVLAVIPVLAGSALLALPFEPLRQIAAHLTVLALTGGIFTEIALIGFHRIPFTCSHLPGKVNVSFAFWAYLVVIIPLTDQYARFEQQALRTPGGCVMLLASLVVLLACFRWWTGRQVGSEALHFSAVPRADIQTLGLQRD